MKNLLKNNIRSWKNNKVSIIGLSFLTFFGLGSYCVLTNTTTNISQQYDSLAKDGVLHDMTISEMYSIGNAHYQTNTKGIIYDYTSDAKTFKGVESFWDDSNKIQTSQLCTANISTISSYGTYYFPIPKQEEIKNGDKVTAYKRTYTITLDPTNSTDLYSTFAKNPKTEEEKKLCCVDFSIVETYVAGSFAEKLQQQIAKQSDITKWTNDECTTLGDAVSIFSNDAKEFNNFVSQQTSKILNYMTTNTKMLNHVANDYADKLDYKLYKALNVTQASNFYKIVNSEPTDTIDKIVLFKDTKGNYGNNLFSASNFLPFNSTLSFINKDKKVVQPKTSIYDGDKVIFTIPSTFPELSTIQIYSLEEINKWTNEDTKYLYSQIIQNRFRVLQSSDIANSENLKNQLLSLVKVIADKDNSNVDDYYKKFIDSTSTIAKDYLKYVSTWNQSYNETINLKADNSIVFTWNYEGMTPQTAKISDWTTNFSVINPQYLKTNNKAVIDPSCFNDFVPYKEWYKAIYNVYPSGNINRNITIKWLNTLTSPQVDFWIKPDANKTISYDNIPNHDPISVTSAVSQATSEIQLWKGINQDSILNLAGFNLIIWGCGLTPDYAYPVVDLTRPTPNFATEAIVYCNSSGFGSSRLAFANSTMEKFIACKFKKKFNKYEVQDILNELNKYATNEGGMSFPKGTKVAFLANDTSNILNSSSLRVSVIPQLISTIKMITLILSSFILALCLIICFIVIKRFVEGNRINIGIMRANGISKKKIAFSLVPFALLPSIIGGIAAYIIGFALQAPAMLLFKDYWTLPTSLVGFSLSTFLGCIFVPFILFSAICLIATLIVLKAKPVDLMKSGSEFKTNAFSRVVKKPFRKFGIMARFRVSLAFNSISRLLMLGIVSTLTMSSLIFGMTTYSRLSMSQAIDSTQKKYQYSIDLTTPTSSGGAYSTMYVDSNSQIGLTNIDDYWYNCSWDLSSEDGKGTWQVTDNYSNYLTKPYAAAAVNALETAGIFFGGYEYRNNIGKQGTLMLPNIGDSTGQKQDLLYLSNKINSKMMLDYNIGVGSLSSNPWEIALALMPANTRNMSNEGFLKMINKTGKLVYEAKKGEKWWYPADSETNEFLKFFTKSNDTYTFNNDITNVGFLFMAFNIPFINLLTRIYSTPEIYKDEMTILYGSVEMNTTDEKYTYVNANIDSLSSRPRVDLRTNNEIKLMGILAEKDKESQFIKLTDRNNNDLNKLLVEPKTKNENIPVVINAYSAHKYRLGIGSTINISATNTVDRHDRKLHDDIYSKESEADKFYKTKLEVVGVSVGTNDDGFYISQNNANNLIGLPNGKSWNKVHKYMMYSDPTTTSWDPDDLNGARPSVVDLSFSTDTASQNLNKNIVYSFTEDTTTTLPSETKIDHINKNIPVGYNGVFTDNPDGAPLTNTMSLYSETGLYPATSVYKSQSDNDKMLETLMFGNNLALANLITGIKDPEAYKECSSYLKGNTSQNDYKVWIKSNFIPKLTENFGDTTMVTSICGAMDVAAANQIYENLISTVNLAETSIMSIIIPITIIIVGIISNLIINDSKRMAAMLKALGYGDKKNIMSILALFVPTIFLGLLLAIPLSLGLVLGYQSLVFTTANILVDVTQKWWYYIVAIGGIGVILLGSYVLGYRLLRKGRLVDQIK